MLIITYYWPPAGGSGVQRWLKFVKYLPEFGIEPMVYCPENANYEAVDESLEKEVSSKVQIIKHKILEPNSVLKKKKVATASVKQRPTKFQKLLQYIRGNYFIPDARKFWIKPSVMFLTNYLKTNPVDFVISTGPPHSLHLIAQQLKLNLGVKWIADFRDPMSNLFYNDSLFLTEKSKQKLRNLEQSILQNADEVITVSNSIQQEFQKIRKNVHVISNGYDSEVLNDKDETQLDKKFSLTHIGLLPIQSNPNTLWKVLADICKENDEFSSDLSIKMIGNVSDEVIAEIEENSLSKNLELVSYVSHTKAIALQKKSQVLLLCIPNVERAAGIITGKLFEYITSNRPILAIAPESGDASKIIRETETGYVCDFEDFSGLKAVILELYDKFKKNELMVNPKNIEQYHRKEITKKLVSILQKN